MKVKFEATGDILFAYLDGEIDHHAAKNIRENIDGMIERSRPHKVVLDFKSVPFSDSSGIAVVLGRYKAMLAIGGTLEVQNACHQVKKVLSLAGVQRLVKIS